jgi:hypothetical protein
MVIRPFLTTYASPLSSTQSQKAKRDENLHAKGTHPFGHATQYHSYRLSFDGAIEQSDMVHVVGDRNIQRFESGLLCDYTADLAPGGQSFFLSHSP